MEYCFPAVCHDHPLSTRSATEVSGLRKFLISVSLIHKAKRDCFWRYAGKPKTLDYTKVAFMYPNSLCGHVCSTGVVCC